MELSAYRGKRVFLTGHTGFKGTWLLVWLHQLGAIVKGFALAPEVERSLYNDVNGDRLCNSVIEDIRNKDRLERELVDFQPDFIFHLAAQPLVRLSYEIPSDTWEVNAMGSVYLLEAVRKLHKPCAVVLITTDKVYENKEWHYPYRETDPLGGYDPYSASKAGAELIIASYRNSFFNPATYDHHQKGIASARAGNVIGGGDWAKDRIIPDIIRALHKQQDVIVRNPNSIRPWQHVLEPISGYLQLGLKISEDPIRFSQAWNFGPRQEDCLSVEQLVQLAIRTWGGGNYVKQVSGNPFHEASLLKLDISKTVQELGWSPKWGATDSIKKTIDWYLISRDGNNSSLQFTSNQIREFFTQA